MQADYVQRLRLTFSKSGATRFIGHLDLARTLERSFNRARIPMAYSQGFNPRPRMQLAAALPLGITSECEIADIWLTETMRPEQLKQQMMAKMAPGISINQISEVPLSEPSLQSQTASAVYSAVPLDPHNPKELQERITALLASPSHIRQRATGKKRKPYDLRPLIIDLKQAVLGNRSIFLTMHLFLKAGKTGRPDEVLLALGLDPFSTRIKRIRLFLASEQD